MPVSIPQEILPAPSVSLSRTGASTATVSVSNAGSYPSECSLIINGATHTLSASTSITIAVASTPVNVYVAYSGSLNIAAASSAYSGTIAQYKLPTPDMRIVASKNSSLKQIVTYYCDNLSAYPEGASFDLTLSWRMSGGGIISSTEITLSKSDFPYTRESSNLMSFMWITATVIVSLSGALDSDEGTYTWSD